MDLKTQFSNLGSMFRVPEAIACEKFPDPIGLWRRKGPRMLWRHKDFGLDFLNGDLGNISLVARWQSWRYVAYLREGFPDTRLESIWSVYLGTFGELGKLYVFGRNRVNGDEIVHFVEFYSVVFIVIIVIIRMKLHMKLIRWEWRTKIWKERYQFMHIHRKS